jgi:TATA-binding protein-associated factor
MTRRSISDVHAILLQMIRQDFTLSSKDGKETGDAEKVLVWEVRHAGLLGIKYEVAVRSDLFQGDPLKGNDFNGQDILRGVVDAAVLG